MRKTTGAIGRTLLFSFAASLIFPIAFAALLSACSAESDRRPPEASTPDPERSPGAAISMRGHLAAVDRENGRLVLTRLNVDAAGRPIVAVETFRYGEGTSITDPSGTPLPAESLRLGDFLDVSGAGGEEQGAIPTLNKIVRLEKGIATPDGDASGEKANQPVADGDAATSDVAALVRKAFAVLEAWKKETDFSTLITEEAGEAAKSEAGPPGAIWAISGVAPLAGDGTWVVSFVDASLSFGQAVLVHRDGDATNAEVITAKPVVMKNAAFRVFRPLPYTVQKGDFLIEGEARVFEGVFHWSLDDGHVEYGGDDVQLDRAAPAWAPFRIRIDKYDGSATNPFLNLNLFTRSPKDGEPDNRLTIPLMANSLRPLDSTNP
ncbi:hypothetical protein TR75_11770 [Hydrogenibacillus schlegelii]|uniref:Bacterial spore germination immunoglobulin-like domain-containing protein n=2 Tax=Hydrogenibacillus schlegelii TaxID=1484 RepID=A0A132MGI6_HYDSH|nr:hypothetical protein TR75_11770 [Hydrogenibacillus schlegelii]OAR05284.1 hypothetical protein SA87_07885 [Hydrogenibacillus schlegelii]